MAIESGEWASWEIKSADEYDAEFFDPDETWDDASRPFHVYRSLWDNGGLHEWTEIVRTFDDKDAAKGFVKEHVTADLAIFDSQRRVVIALVIDHTAYWEDRRVREAAIAKAAENNPANNRALPFYETALWHDRSEFDTPEALVAREAGQPVGEACGCWVGGSPYWSVVVLSTDGMCLEWWGLAWTGGKRVHCPCCKMTVEQIAATMKPAEEVEDDAEV